MNNTSEEYIKNPSKGILHFWIIHKNSGITIFSQQFSQFSKNPPDTDLFGGFLVALLGFAEELANQQIDLMQLSNLRLIYNIREKVVMVALTSLSADPNRIRLLLDHVQRRFDEKYAPFIQKDIASDVRVFQDFAKITEEIFECETQYLTIIKSRAASVDDYFKKASDEWRHMHQSILNHNSLTNEWSGVQVLKINKTIQRDLLHARTITKNLINSKQAIINKNIGWISPK